MEQKLSKIKQYGLKDVKLIEYKNRAKVVAAGLKFYMVQKVSDIKLYNKLIEDSEGYGVLNYQGEKFIIFPSELGDHVLQADYDNYLNKERGQL